MLAGADLGYTDAVVAAPACYGISITNADDDSACLPPNEDSLSVSLDNKNCSFINIILIWVRK